MRKERVLSEYFAEIGRKGGKASADKLTKQERTERATKASHARKAVKKRKGKA